MHRPIPYYLLVLLFLFACPQVVRAQTADFSISPASGCAPLVVNFTDLSTGAITGYNWNLGNSVTSTQQNPSTTYTSPGTYNVTLIVNGPSGTDTKTATVTVYDKPVVSFAAAGALAGCTPHNVQFNSTVTPNSPGTVNYSWDFGDGTSGTGSNPAHTYTTPGIYTVLLTVTNGAGCSQTFVQNAYINARPIPNASFTANQTYFCSAPATVSFSNNSTGGGSPYATSWDFGDGGTAIGNSTSHAYSTGGIFTVSMIVTDPNGCADTLVNNSLVTVIGTLPTFNAPASVCELVNSAFINTTPGYSSTSWDFGDGNVDPNANIAYHVYLTAGTYTVTMTTVVAGCTKTLSKTIVVDPKPVPTISMIPPIPCPPPVTVQFSATSSVSTTTNFNWSWQSGGTASGTTVSKFYPRSTTPPQLNYALDAVTLITTSAAGCKDTLRIDTVYIRNIFLSALPGYDICAPRAVISKCFPLTLGFSTRLNSLLPLPPPGSGCGDLPIYPYSPASWLWDFGDGSPKSTLATPSHTYPVYGNYRATVLITTPNGCVDSQYMDIHTDSPVHPSFTAAPLSVCQKEPVYFTNTTTNILPGTTFVWGAQDVRFGITDTTVRSVGLLDGMGAPHRPGSYTVFLTANHNGCEDTAYRHYYVQVHPPDAQFADSTFCGPNYTTVKFINLTDSATSSYWIFGDGTTSTATNPTHTYPSLGNYAVTLVVHNNIYNCFDTLTRPLQLFAPSFDFKATDTTICPYESIRFTSTYYGYGTPEFSFSADSNITAFDTTGTGTFKFTKTGYHDVIMYVKSGNNCVDTMIKPGYILVSQPGIKYDLSPAIGCKPMNVTFRDSSDNVPGIPNVSWKWAFGDGDTVITKVPSITRLYDTVGTFIVRLVVTDTNGCESDLRFGYDTISVHKPVASYTLSDTSVCAFEQVRFTDTSTLARTLNHQWSFGDGTFDTGVAPKHFYTMPGKYPTRLVVTDAVGCTDTLSTDSIRVNAPSAAFSQSDTLGICPPLLVRFSNQSAGATSYLWDFGQGGSKVVVTNPVSTFQNPGIFNITLVAIDANGCTDTATSRVRVLGYSGAFTYTPIAGCAPMNVAFSTPLNGIAQITWDYGDGVINTTSSTTATHTYQNAGPYMPKVIFSDGASCVSSSLGLDTIRVDQVKADFGWTVPCAGTAFTLNDSSSAIYNTPDRWFWLFGNGDTAAGTPATHTYATPGNHRVTLVAANATGCKDTITKNVFVNDLPNIDATDDTAICPGDAVRLLVQGGLNYTWSPTPDSMHNCPVCDVAFVHLSDPTPGAFAYFTVRGTDTNGCVNSDSTKVTIQIKTTSSVGQGGEICVGESFRLHASGAQKYEWMPKESIDSPFIASPLATPQRTTTYIVAAQEGSCLVDSQHVQVVVHSRPIFSAGNDEIIALGAAVTLKPTKSGIVRIEWVPDTTLTCYNCFDPTAHPYYTRTYIATGYNEYGCSATDSVTVHVRCNGSLVFIPNTFTPNADGKNDYFFPRGEGIEQINVVRIFNRWGEMVFERKNVPLNDERYGWDGRYMGKELAPDVYVYYMQSTCSTGEDVKWKGDITLMR